MRVAIGKECTQIPEEMLLDVSRCISLRYKKRIEQNGTSLSIYVNSSLCKHFEIAPSVLYRIKSLFNVFLYILFSKSLNVYSFSCINFIYKSKSII